MTIQDMAHEGYKNIFTNSATVSEAPTWEDMLQTLHKFRERKSIVVSTELGSHYTRETLSTVRDWANGINMPQITDFNRWWLAISCKLRLPSLKLYKMDDEFVDQMENAFEVKYHTFPRLPPLPISDKPLYFDHDRISVKEPKNDIYYRRRFA